MKICRVCSWFSYFYVKKEKFEENSAFLYISLEVLKSEKCIADFHISMKYIQTQVKMQHFYIFLCKRLKYEENRWF